MPRQLVKLLSAKTDLEYRLHSLQDDRMSAANAATSGLEEEGTSAHPGTELDDEVVDTEQELDPTSSASSPLTQLSGEQDNFVSVEETSINPGFGQWGFGGGTPSNDSVTAALSRQGSIAGYEPFFRAGGRSIDLFCNEPLAVSVERLHGSYDPADTAQDDPLLIFGAVDGVLPGYAPNQTLLLRDVVIRYGSEQRNFLWDNVSSAVIAVNQYDASSVSLILDGLTAFTGRTFATRLVVDPNFGFLYRLEEYEDEVQIRFVFSMLQLRLMRADENIRKQLKRIRRTITGVENEGSISSANSTLSEVRLQYGTVSKSHELHRMLARKDYGQRVALIDPEVQRAMAKSIRDVEDINPDPYRRRSRQGAIPTIRELNEERDRPTRTGYLGPPHNVRFAAQASSTISAFQRLPTISTLPGVGKIPNLAHAALGTQSSNGRPSMMRTGNQMKGVLPPPAATQDVKILPEVIHRVEEVRDRVHMEEVRRKEMVVVQVEDLAVVGVQAIQVEAVSGAMEVSAEETGVILEGIQVVEEVEARLVQL
ncbi:hypothetical protein FB45DRAFT_1032067 [Roridomyces roridus]|uniref:Uncharacterized protein n=1 Tax=Roridomyces roridus TaxID=1738132 RepID=A0AAD7BJD0_9AGAR|nr:hypothetical protein FB45DRAFT_1032067 [Roridomyces roridus]